MSVSLYDCTVREGKTLGIIEVIAEVISIQLGRNELHQIPECHGRIKAIRFVVP